MRCSVNLCTKHLASLVVPIKSQEHLCSNKQLPSLKNLSDENSISRFTTWLSPTVVPSWWEWWMQHHYYTYAMWLVLSWRLWITSTTLSELRVKLETQTTHRHTDASHVSVKDCHWSAKALHLIRTCTRSYLSLGVHWWCHSKWYHTTNNKNQRQI